MQIGWPRPLKRIISLTRKEIQTIVKDRTALIMIFLLPVITIGTLALAIQQNDVQAEIVPMNFGVIDLDTTTTYPGEDLSENFTATLDNLENVVVSIIENETEAYNALFEGTIDAYIIIEDGFEHSLAMDLPAFLEIHTSSTDFQGSSDVIIAVTEASMLFRVDHGWIRSEIIPETVLEFVPEGDLMAAQVGAFLVIFCIFMAIAMTSCQSIVGDIPLRRMLLTPTSKVEVIFAKLSAYTIIGVIQSLFLNILWIIMFELQLSTGFETLMIISTLTAFAGAVSGVFISSICTSRLQANQGFLFLLLGMMILSGMFLDVGVIKEFLPINLGMTMIHDTAFKGLTLANNLPEIGRTLFYCVGGTFLSILILWRKRTLA
ncbi:MAG: ABC transporter permease [Promethearchaeota archaeon]